MNEPRHTLETVRRALEHISPDIDREQWVRVLAAGKSEFGDDGRELMQEWSSGGSSYKAADFRAAWKSLRPDGGVTIGTLFALAKAGGFVHVRASAGNVAAPDRSAERAQREAKEEALRARKRERAALEARRRFEAASESGRAPYLERKGVRAHGVRVEPDGTLLVPMRDEAGELGNLQAVAPDGEKRFLPGGPVVGLLHWLGDPAGAATVALAEGYATAATVHEATGLPVAVAFNTANLPRVARQVRDAWPAAVIVALADDDRETAARSGKNPGRLAAAEAARVGRAVVAVPAPLEAGETDFNDLARRAGPEAVAAIVHAAAASLATREAPAESDAPAASADDAGPFEVGPAGVWFLARDRDGRTSRQWVCGPLEVEARTRDEAGGAWGFLIAFSDPEGTQKRIAIPARLFAGDGAELRGRLLDEGLAIASGPARNRLLHFIATRRVERRVRCVETIGWHSAAFVLPARSYGPNAGDVHFQTADERPRDTFRMAGTLDDWRAGVAALAIGNPRLAFLVALAFAGPCVHLVGAASGGFHCFGASSKGKTTALAVGASVWGPPEHGTTGFIRTWRATGNAVEATAAAHSDATLFLDEMREADPRELVQTVLMLGNGVGKQRMRSGGSQRVPHSWRLLFASTGERTIAESAALAGVPVDAGAGVRLVEIPVPEHGAFDELHGARDGAAFAEQLRAAAMRAYGTAGDAWLSYLTEHRDEARAFLLACSRELLDAWREHGDAGQTARVAARFALVAAAGELATRAGITGWPAGEAERAAHALFRAWAAARGTRGDAEALAALRQVAGLLGQHAESFFPWWHRGADDRRPNAPKRWGLRRLVDELGNEPDSQAERDATYGEGAITEEQGKKIAAKFYVLVSSWRDELCQGFDPRYVAAVLHRSGYLVPGPDKRLDRKERLPGIGPARCYVVKPSIFEDESL
jgi:putative DNA primase/helicase